jgi:hypothetical protein
MRACHATVLALLISFPAACLGQIGIGGWVQNQSPDGRLVEVNGGIWSPTTHILGWVYDWGDGTRGTGYFPLVHRYAGPDVYTITLTGYDDAGDSESAYFQHEVPVPPPSETVRVVASTEFCGLKCGDSLVVHLTAYDSMGDSLDLDGRPIEFFSPRSDLVDVSVREDGIVIRALPLGDADFGWAWVTAYVEGVEADDPVNIITNKNAGNFAEGAGEYVGVYLPEEFFTLSDIDLQEFIHIVDVAFGIDLWAVDGKNPSQGDRPLFQGISYAPPLYGGSGNPLGLGDYALPDDGVPRFAVVFHEMGHNFSGVNMFFNSMAIPGPLYQETIAEWFVQFDLNTMIEEHAVELSPEALDMLIDIRDEGRAYHLWEYENYVNGGCEFDYYDISASHALVEKVYEYCSAGGWGKLLDFLRLFEADYLPDYSAILAGYGGIGPEENRVAFLMAALSHTFGQDLRGDFLELDFPHDVELYYDLLAYFGWEIGIDDGGDAASAELRARSWPNPAGESAVVEYVLPGPGDVKVTLYDVRGRELATLADGPERGGAHRVEIDTTRLSAGVYLCRVAAGGADVASKLVVAK